MTECCNIQATGQSTCYQRSSDCLWWYRWKTSRKCRKQHTLNIENTFPTLLAPLLWCHHSGLSDAVTAHCHRRLCLVVCHPHPNPICCPTHMPQLQLLPLPNTLWTLCSLSSGKYFTLLPNQLSERTQQPSLYERCILPLAILFWIFSMNRGQWYVFLCCITFNWS